MTQDKFVQARRKKEAVTQYYKNRRRRKGVYDVSCFWLSLLALSNAADVMLSLLDLL